MAKEKVYVYEGSYVVRQSTEIELKRIWFYLNNGVQPKEIINKMVSKNYTREWSSIVVNGTIDDAYDSAFGNIY